MIECGGEAEDRGDDRQRHRRRRAEGQEQDDHGRAQPHRLAALGARLGELGAHVAADRRLHPGLLRRLGGVQDVLGLGVGQVAGADVEQHRDLGDLAVLAQQARRGERIGRADDVVDLRERRDGVLDGLLVVAGVELPALGLEDDRVGPVGLFGQALLELVLGVLGLRPRQRDVVVRAIAGGAADRNERDRPYDPQDDDNPVVSRAQPSQVIEGPRHLSPTLYDFAACDWFLARITSTCPAGRCPTS